MGAPVNISGQKYGILTAIKPTEKRKNGSVVWKCRCDCGNYIYVDSKSLRQGFTTNCGCLKRERTRKMGQDRVKDIAGQRFGKLVAIEPTKERRGGYVVWKCKCDCGNYTHAGYGHLVSGNTTSCGCVGIETSIKNGTKAFAEYKENTYVANTRLDVLDRKKINKNNTTGYTGVYKRGKKYVANIEFQGKRYFLGYFNKIADAAAARKTAEKKLHGEFLDWYENEYKAGKNGSKKNKN